MSVQLLNRTTCVCTRALRKARLCLSESNASVFHWTSYHSSVTCSSPVGDDRGGPEQGPLGGLRSSGEARWSYAKGKGKRGPHGPDGALGLGGRISSEVRNLSKEDLPKRKPKTPQRARAEGGGKDSEIVFGVAPCLLALSQGRRTMTKLYVKKGRVLQRGDVQEVYERARRLGLEVQQVSKKELDQICSGRVHQGICLEASPLGYLPAEGASERDCVDSTETPLWLLLDGIQDPMNLGAILRSAYFLGVDRIASSLRNSCPLTPVVSKASSGAMEVMGVYGYESPANVLKVKRAQGWHIVGTVGAAKEDPGVPVLSCSEYRLTKPTILILGSEGEGLSPELRGLCQALLTVAPRRALHPGVESLNVSVAAGILLHSLISSQRVNER